MHHNEPMQRYKDLGGNSGIVAYRLGCESSDIEFRGGGRYRYTYRVPGPQHVEAMKQLAGEGRHLATYINRHVQNRYALRLR